MSYHEKEKNLNNRNNKNTLNDKMSSILDLVIEDDTYQEGKNKIIDLFKKYITNGNEKIIKICLTIISNMIILKGNFKHKILSIIPEISQIEPKSFFEHIDIILSIFQSCLTDDNSPYYSQISQYFGDTVKVLLKELNSENYNTYIIKDSQQNVKNNQKSLLLAYTKFKLFCLSNIKSTNTGCQICGTLCLTSFIENCSFNYINNENLKCIFDNLCMQINNPNFPGKLEILNCFISLVFCSEEKFVPYSIMTLNIIIKFINDQEWLIRKFALNIIYTMLYYCKKEILEKKEYILENLKLLGNEENIEIKEISEQIYKMITEEDSTNMSYNNKINYFSDSLMDSNNSKFSSGEQSKNFYNNNNYSMSNKEFKIKEEEKNGEEIVKSKNIASTEPIISKKKFQTSFYNHKNNNEKPKIKAKSDQKRKTVNKTNNKISEKFINNSSSKNIISKLPNNPNNNNANNGNIETHSHKKRKVFSDNLANKTRNKRIPPSRNSLEKFYDFKKNNPISMILKKRNILDNCNNINSINKNIKIKPKEKKSIFGINASEKQKKIIGLNQKQNNIKNINNKKNYKTKYNINEINKSNKIKNLNQNIYLNKQKQIKGRNDFIKSNNFISSTTININNNLINNRDLLTLNKIPSFGKGSEEDVHSPLYSEENSEYIEEMKAKAKLCDNNKIKNKDKLIKLQKNKNHNYSFENKKTHSKNNFINRSLENHLLNFSGYELNNNKEFETKAKIQNTLGKENYINQNKNGRTKQIFNSSFRKNENSYNNENIGSKYRYNNSQKNNKIKRVTKLNKKRMSTEMKNKIINNKNNYEKDTKINEIDNKSKLSPSNKLQNNFEYYNLFHSFSNKENDNNINKKKHNKQKSNNIKIDSQKNTHKVNHSFQINNNDKNIKSKMKNINNSVKTIQNKKIKIQRKANNIKDNDENHANNNINNNLNSNNNIVLIKDNKPLIEVTNNELNFELISRIDKNDVPIELKFKEYKNETSKIINDLKLQVNFLKTTLGNFEEITKKKEKLNNEIKNKNYIEGFKTAIEIGNIQDIYYVIKKYQLSSIQEQIPQNILAGVMKILCEDILSCENLRLITIFIINNICNNNIKFEKLLNKEIFSIFIDLYNKRKELCFMKKDINNILKIANYFSIFQ